MAEAFRIELTPEAIDDLRLLRKYDQQQIVAAIQAQLTHQPTQETRNRKRLRPNALAEWELCIGVFRVFYDVDAPQAVVKVEAIGYKRGNTLFIQGEEYEL
jgi:mRNA-degrading endonuclease RelE of RelBE toxin-antitoxin system